MPLPSSRLLVPSTDFLWAHVSVRARTHTHTHVHLPTNTHTQAYTRAHTHIHRHAVQPGLNGSWLEGETGLHSCSCGSFLRPRTSCTNSADTDRLALSCLRPVTAVKGCVRGPLQPSVHRANVSFPFYALCLSFSSPITRARDGGWGRCPQIGEEADDPEVSGMLSRSQKPAPPSQRNRVRAPGSPLLYLTWRFSYTESPARTQPHWEPMPPWSVTSQHRALSDPLSPSLCPSPTLSLSLKNKHLFNFF